MSGTANQGQFTDEFEVRIVELETEYNDSIAIRACASDVSIIVEGVPSPNIHIHDVEALIRGLVGLLVEPVKHDGTQVGREAAERVEQKRVLRMLGYPV